MAASGPFRKPEECETLLNKSEEDNSRLLTENGQLRSKLAHRRRKEIYREIGIAIVIAIASIIATYFIDKGLHENSDNKLHAQIAGLNAEVEKWKSSSPVGLTAGEPYPNRTKTMIEKLVPDLTSHDRLMILLGFVGHEHYSNPSTFSEYIDKLRNERRQHSVVIEMAVGGPEDARDSITDQFRMEYWVEQGPGDKPAKPGQGNGTFGYWGLKDPNHPESQERSFKTYNDYVDYYTHTRPVIPRDKIPRTYIDFLNTLTRTQNVWCDDLHGVATVRTIPYRLSKHPINFWMIAHKRVLFTFPAFSTLAVGQGRSFVTENAGNQPFLEMLEQHFEALWEPTSADHLAMFRNQLNNMSWRPESDPDYEYFLKHGACYQDLFTLDTPQVANQIGKQK